MTLPATKLAVATLDSWIVGLGRALVAATLAAVLLRIFRVPMPNRPQSWRLGVVSMGVIIGFPVLTALALRSVPASHAAVVAGLLPAATATLGTLRARERPPLRLWFGTALGLMAVVTFCVGHELGALQTADLYLLGSVACAALGYTEGAILARQIGAWQVICWALVFTAPALLPIVAWRLSTHGWAPSAPSLFGFAYVSLVSMLLAFFAWYRGLSLGGIARIGQLQLLQPILTLLWSNLLLGEELTRPQIISAVVVIGCVAVVLWRPIPK